MLTLSEVSSHPRQIWGHGHVNSPSRPRPAGTVELGISATSAHFTHVIADSVVVWAIEGVLTDKEVPTTSSFQSN